MTIKTIFIKGLFFYSSIVMAAGNDNRFFIEPANKNMIKLEEVQNLQWELIPLSGIISNIIAEQPMKTGESYKSGSKNKIDTIYDYDLAPLTMYYFRDVRSPYGMLPCDPTLRDQAELKNAIDRARASNELLENMRNTVHFRFEQDLQ